MSLTAKVLSACGGAEEKIYVDDVFSAYTYTGKGAAQVINNSIDLLGKGGMVWTKCRSNLISHVIQDTIRGGNSVLQSDKVEQAQNLTSNSFNSNGYTLANDLSYGLFNWNNYTYASWTFRKAPKFFDVVTYTGNGVAGRTIAHSLGIAPGMIIVKRTTGGSDDWYVWHRSNPTPANQSVLSLNTTAPWATSSTIWGSTDPTGSNFTVGSVQTNESGATYIAYLFAHDPSADGIIQCGGYVGNGSIAGPVITLDWEPQFILIKKASATEDWYVYDALRGMTVGGIDPSLSPNTSSTESVPTTSRVSPNASGFLVDSTDGAVNTSASTYIYLAIRRPNKPPTSGTEVFQSVLWQGNRVANRNIQAGLTADMVMVRERGEATYNGGSLLGTRLLGDAYLTSASTGVETTSSFALQTPTSGYGNSFSTMDGFGVGAGSTTIRVNYNTTANQHLTNFFKRAPGFFDVVCYTGTGVARTVNHNLGVAPELMIVKSRSGAYNWMVYATDPTKFLLLHSLASAATNSTYWNDTLPTATQINLGINTNTNLAAATYVAYLFASLAGISKVGTYTGNGTNHNIECGFSAGSRFVMIKRTDSTGDWFIFDTARGISSGTDPHLSLNTTAAEVTTDDSIDPYAGGFAINQLAATNLNVNAATYIFLAIA